jgi:hypothetical protein
MENFFDSKMEVNLSEQKKDLLKVNSSKNEESDEIVEEEEDDLTADENDVCNYNDETVWATNDDTKNCELKLCNKRNHFCFEDYVKDNEDLDISLEEFMQIRNFDAKKIFKTEFWFMLNDLDPDAWFVIPEEVINSIGYKNSGKEYHHRGSLFRLIKKQFVETKDYRLLSTCAGSGSSMNSKRLHLEMKRDSFKKLLMKINTEHSDQIYDYLIAFENTVLEYKNYQNRAYLYKMDRQIKKLKMENEKNVPLSTVPQVQSSCSNPNGYEVSKDQPVVYMIQISSINKIKFGYTNNFSNRLRKHRQVFGDIILQYVIETQNAARAEGLLKQELQARGLMQTLEFNKKKFTEMVDIEHFDTVKLILEDLIKRLLDEEDRKKDPKFSASQNHEFRMKEIEIKIKETEKEKCMKEIEGKIKSKEIELEIEKIKLEMFKIEMSAKQKLVA